MRRGPGGMRGLLPGALLLTLATMAAANNASFQFLFPRTLLLFEVPLFLFVLWRMRPPPQDRLYRVVLGLTAALSLLGWVTGEALWYWESADLSLRWSDGRSASYCRSLMSHLRALDHLDSGCLEPLLPISGGRQDPRVWRLLTDRRDQLVELASREPGAFGDLDFRALTGRPGRLSIMVAHTRCPRGGGYAWDAARAALVCTVHGPEATVATTPGAWDDRLPDLERVLQVAHSGWPLTLPAWLLLLGWGIAKGGPGRDPPASPAGDAPP